MRSLDPHDAGISLELDRPLVRSSEVLATALGDREAVMLDIEHGTYFGVEGVARVIWDALEQPVTPREVVGLLRSRYPDVDPEECERDAMEFLEDLVRYRLVQRYAPPEPA